MNKIPKRTLDEIVFFYKHNPSRTGVDFFVEGPSDKLLIDSYLKARRGRVSPVYTMDSIDFSGVDFSGLGLPTPSARSCVVVLRKVLVEEGVDLSKNFFLVDRDIEDVCPTPLINGVELTDSGALPVHLYDNRVEKKISELIYKSGIDSVVLKNSVNSICKSIYMLRAAARNLDCGVRILSPADFIRGDAISGFSLDARAYIERCLHASDQYSRLEDICLAYDKCREQLDSMALRGFSLINDHSLWDVLKEIGARVEPSNNRSSKDIEEIVRMTFDADELSGHRLFCSIDKIIDEALAG